MTRSYLVLLVGSARAHGAIADALPREAEVQEVDGPRALARIAGEGERLVLVDAREPAVLQRCSELRAVPGCAVHLIALVDRGDDGAAQDALELADDVLALPLAPAEVRARLQVAHRVLTQEERLRRQQRRLDELNRALADRATLDPLMGIGNRRSFEQTIGKAHVNARKHGIAYGVLMADVDRFKSYNDLYGHQAGDRVLEKVARALRKALRGGDKLFRYGGEELVLVTRTGRQQTLDAMGERLRVAVEELDISHDGSDSGRVTCSLGGALHDPGAERAGSPWDQVVERADTALYRAKEQGRNRMVLWDGDVGEAEGNG